MSAVFRFSYLIFFLLLVELHRLLSEVYTETLFSVHSIHAKLVYQLSACIQESDERADS